MSGLLSNKWVHFGVGLASTLVAFLAATDWASLTPTAAGAIVTTLGVLNTLIHVIPNS